MEVYLFATHPKKQQCRKRRLDLYLKQAIKSCVSKPERRLNRGEVEKLIQTTTFSFPVKKVMNQTKWVVNYPCEMTPLSFRHVDSDGIASPAGLFECLSQMYAPFKTLGLKKKLAIIRAIEKHELHQRYIKVMLTRTQLFMLIWSVKPDGHASVVRLASDCLWCFEVLFSISSIQFEELLIDGVGDFWFQNKNELFCNGKRKVGINESREIESFESTAHVIAITYSGVRRSTPHLNSMLREENDAGICLYSKLSNKLIYEHSQSCLEDIVCFQINNQFSFVSAVDLDGNLCFWLASEKSVSKLGYLPYPIENNPFDDWTQQSIWISRQRSYEMCIEWKIVLSN